MKNALGRLLKFNSGFSLVEAIVSVVILGIAIIPISTVFTVTITRTVDTRKQLEANELAQYYVENLKNKEFNDFYRVFGMTTGSVVEIEPSMDLVNYGLQDVPSGYRVALSYEEQVDNVHGGIFAMPSVNKKDALIYADPDNPKDDERIVDAEINFESDVSTKTDIVYYDSGLVKEEIWPNPWNSYTDRTINIKVTRGEPSESDTFTVAYEANGTESGTTDAVPIEFNRFIIDIGDSASGEFVNTVINISSEIPEEIEILIFEKDDNNVHPITNIEKGRVSISRNLYDLDRDQNRIVEIKVDIYDEITGEVITTLTGTKINE